MIFSLIQLQEKCREQRQPLFITFIDLTRAFDLVSRDGLFKILPKIGCPPRLLSIIRSFHEDMKGTVVFDGSTSAAFNMRSGVKQVCVLAPTLFGIFFAVVLKHAFGPAAEGTYLRTRAEGKLFNLSRLRAKTKVQLRCLRDFLFAEDAAVTAHSAEDLQQLMTRFSDACQDFGLTISLKKTQVMGQDTTPPQPSASMTMNWMSSMTSFTWAQLSQTPSNLTQSSTAHRQGSYHHDQTDKESMEQQQADRAHKDPDLQSLRREHSPVWQRVLDIACPTGAKAQCFFTCAASDAF